MNKVGDTLIHTASNENLVQDFVSSKVEFLLVGGLAVAWYCPTQREADDMDLLVNPTRENSVRIADVLMRHHFSGFDADLFARLGLQVPLKRTLYADLLTPQTGTASFEEIARTAINGKLFGIPIQIASVASLIKLKERAANAVDASAEKHRGDILLLQAYAENSGTITN